MKMILERKDVIAIMEQHFQETFDVDKIVMPEQFEIEIHGIPLPPSMASRSSSRAPADEDAPPRRRPAVVSATATPEELEAAAALVARRADGDASTDDPPPGNDEMGSTEVSGSPMSVLQQSRELQAQLDRDLPAPKRQGGQATPPTYGREEF